MHSSSMILSLAILTTIFSPALAIPQLPGLVGQLLNLIPVLGSPPPAFLMTKKPSPVCANVNQGTLLCCESTFNGDIPLVVYTSSLLAYKLNKNSINCIYGERMRNANSTCSPGTKLCCQVDALVDTPVKDIVNLAVYCQNAPTQV